MKDRLSFGAHTVYLKVPCVPPFTSSIPKHRREVYTCLFSIAQLMVATGCFRGFCRIHPNLRPYPITEPLRNCDCAGKIPRKDSNAMLAGFKSPVIQHRDPFLSVLTRVFTRCSVSMKTSNILFTNQDAEQLPRFLRAAVLLSMLHKYRSLHASEAQVHAYSGITTSPS